ncbi:MAG TPA: molybdopterin-dependent oxidoreductase [Thermoanaerobaculia bacterium]
MTDEPEVPEVPEVPAEEIVISDGDTLRKAIAVHDAVVDREVRRLSRRGFVVAGVATVAAYGAWKWLRLAKREGDVPWPLRRGLEANEKIAEAYFSNRRLSREFPPSAISANARINGGVGLQANYDPDHWRLQIEGISGQPPASLSLADIKAFPRRDMTTELRCIEGWSIIVHWTGARLADVMAKFPPPPRTPYVAMESPGGGYYVGLDMLSCMHPQTLLAYEINGAPLSWQHGAPLRLAMPVKYGYKQIKRIATIRYTTVRPTDFWGDRGYDWYGGH